MVLQIFAHARQIVHGSHIHLLQLVLGAHAAEQEDLWRVDGTSAEHHLLLRHYLARAAKLIGDLHAQHVLRVRMNQYLGNCGVQQDVQIVAHASGSQEGPCRAIANAIARSHLGDHEARGILPVQILHRVAHFLAGLENGIGERRIVGEFTDWH